MRTNDKAVKIINNHGPLGWVLFTAYVGAVIYFAQLSPTFLGFIVALFKAAVWPAYVLYKVLGLLQIR